MSKPRKRHYVNNRALYEKMVEYKEKVRLAAEGNLPKPRVPEYVGECLLLIASRLSNKPSFYGYSYKEEMISDGVENCIKYLDNFDPEKSNNPFGYFTQIIKNSFLRRIDKEKKEQYVKIKNFENSILYDDMVDESSGPVAQPANRAKVRKLKESFIEPHYDFIKTFEDKLVKKKKVKKTGIDLFVEEDNEVQSN